MNDPNHRSGNEPDIVEGIVLRNILEGLGDERAPKIGERDLEYIQELRNHLLQKGVAAIYGDYYGQRSIYFLMGTERRPDLPADQIDVPADQWDSWRIVESGPRVYAEPVTTTVYEQGATPHEPAGYMLPIHDELDGETPPSDERQGELLLKLGHLPLSEEGLLGMEEQAIEKLALDESLVIVQGETVVVATPGKGGDDAVTEFTHGNAPKPLAGSEYRYGRAGIPKAQRRFLARYAARQVKG